MAKSKKWWHKPPFSVLKQCVDLCLQLSLADYTNMLVDNLAALDEYEGRNIANTVVC